MNLHSSTTSETDDIEFSAAYGTTVVMTGARRTAIRNHHLRALEGGSGTLTNRLNTATGTDRHVRDPYFPQPHNTVPNPVQRTAPQSTPLAAANDVGKRQGKRSLLRGEQNGRRKAA